MDDNPTDASFWEPLGGYVEVKLALHILHLHPNIYVIRVYMCIQTSQLAEAPPDAKEPVRKAASRLYILGSGGQVCTPTTMHIFLFYMCVMLPFFPTLYTHLTHPILRATGVRPHPLRRQADQGPAVLRPDLPPADPLQAHDMGRRQGSPGQQEGRNGEHYGVYQSGKGSSYTYMLILSNLYYVYV